MTLYIILFLLVGVVAIFIKYSLRRKNYSKLVPAVTPNFFNIFGDLAEFITCKDRHLYAMELLRRRREMFQKEELMCFWSAFTPLIYPLKANSVKEVLKVNKMLDKGWMYDFLKPILGEGLLTSAGEKWKFQKRILTPCFHSDILRNFITIFNKESQNLITVLEEETTKDFTYIANKTSLCLLDIASETICGVTIDALKGENVEYLNSLRRIADVFMSRVYSPWYWPDVIFKNTKMFKDMIRSQNIAQQVTRNVIIEKRNRFLNGEKITLTGKRKAMMDLLLEKHFETKELSEEDISEQVHTFLIAGHETVGASMTWMLFLLGHHPEVQAKVHEELDRVFGDDRERHVTEEDLRDLPYLSCVFKETLRIYPGIPIFARECPEDTKISGCPVSKGTACVIFVYGLHRDEDVFPDPERFDPDRFSPENSAKIPDCAYIPFAAGPRNCIGYKYADIMLRIVLSWIMRNFTLESLDPKEKAMPIMNVGLHSSIPIRIRIRPRSLPKTA